MKKQILNTIIRRIFTSLIVLFLLITFIFFLLRISPGNPTQKFISPELSPKLAEKVKESFNLDKPLFKQYESFIGNLIKGNFGISYTYRAPVLSVIWNFLPFTLMFSLMSFIIQIGFGFLLSFLAVKNINGKLDHLISKSSLMIYAIPSFVIGVSLIYIFSVQFNLLPSSGFSSINSYSLSFIGKLWDHLEHLILPLITLSLGGIAIYFRYLRDNLEDVYNQTFILNLRANGFSEKEITKKHVIPNAVSPLISVAGVELGLLFSGALITEVIFGLPGMGRLTINAILSRDYPLVIGCTFVSGVLIIISNLIADLFKAKIDKRLLKEILN